MKRAENFGLLEISDILEKAFIKEKKRYVPYLFAKQHTLLPFEEKDGRVHVAIADPLNLISLEELRLILSKEIVPFYCPEKTLKEAIEVCYHQKDEEKKQLFLDVLAQSKTKFVSEEEGYDLLERASQNPVINMLNSIVIEAIQQKASDIHFEPQENGFAIRYRIDGILQSRTSPPHEYQSQIITRIKVMAKLDIAEQRLPQDGRIKLKMGGRDIDFRVSTMPVVYGERIALRILDKENVILGLGQIGMCEETLCEFRSLIKMSEGIVLVTGPTGSGKTTTLYSAISEINSSECNIMTVEDPVEYKLPAIAQIAVNPKINLTFAKGLRHILRQDPDAIMIGEIRDKETAEIAVQASLTGHLVLSTLHTNDAASSLARLVDMGIEPYLLSSSIIGILAQRLVRRICPHCKKAYKPTASEIAQLKIPKEQTKNIQFYSGTGCDECFHSGYKGRTGVYELLTMSTQIKKQIAKSVDSEEIKNIALTQNMIDLRKSGSMLVLQGITTSAEVMRVARIAEGS